MSKQAHPRSPLAHWQSQVRDLDVGLKPTPHYIHPTLRTRSGAGVAGCGLAVIAPHGSCRSIRHPIRHARAPPRAAPAPFCFSLSRRAKRIMRFDVNNDSLAQHMRGSRLRRGDVVLEAALRDREQQATLFGQVNPLSSPRGSDASVDQRGLATYGWWMAQRATTPRNLCLVVLMMICATKRPITPEAAFIFVRLHSKLALF